MTESSCSSDSARIRAGTKRKLSEVVPCSPSDFVLSTFVENGFKLAQNPSELERRLPFLEVSQEMIDGYKLETIRHVRCNDLESLRKVHKDGGVLQCCNRFGESLIHMACRRGLTDMVRFLVEEADVSLLVRDDYGRTPLHDAFWTPEPNFELAEFIISQVPEFLCVKDVRGHTPLSYIRKEHFRSWQIFMEERKESLRFKIARTE